jgi:YVTN family beta-propeller protein
MVRDLIVANAGSDDLSIIQSSDNRVIESVNVGDYPNSLAYDPANGDIYVANLGSNTVMVLNGSNFQLAATVDVGSFPQGISVDPSNGYVFVTDSGDPGNGYGANLSVISTATNRVVATLSVGMRPMGVAFDNLDDSIYVANFVSNNLSVISAQTLQVVKSIRLPSFSSPEGLTLDPRDGLLWVYDTPICMPVTFCTNSISSVNSSTSNIASEVNTTSGSSFGRIIYIPFDGLLAVTAGDNCTLLPPDCSPSYVSFVDSETNTYIGSLQLGAELNGLAFDPLNNELYVADSGQDVVYAVLVPSAFPHYRLDFEEAGLPSGTGWSVILRDSNAWRCQSSKSGSNVFLSGNGSFKFQIAGPTGYSSTSSNGTVNVSGSSLVIHIEFSESPWIGALTIEVVLIAAVATLSGVILWRLAKRRRR